MFYGMNMATGEEGYYVYDSVGLTLQRYDNEIITKLNTELQEKENELKTLYISIIILVIFIIFIIVMFSVKNHKIKKTLNLKKDKKESKE